LETNSYELRKLQEKLEQLSRVDRVVQLEGRLKDARTEKAELERQIRLLEKQNND